MRAEKGDDDGSAIHHEQLAYDRARAQKYVESTRDAAELQGVFARARELLQRRDPCEQVLELARGIGTWTQVLLAIGQEVTAIDAAPEMLAISPALIPLLFGIFDPREQRAAETQTVLPSEFR